MGKYKDFEELPSQYDERVLRELFVQRNHVRQGIDNPKANDIALLDEDPKLRVYQVPDTFELEQARFEVSYLHPEEVPDRYTRKAVEAYLQMCHQIIKEEAPPSTAKTFPQFLNNLEGKEVQFADRLRAKFSDGRGRQIRYMIEALKELNLLSYGQRERESLYQSMKVYFNRGIGAKTGIFDPKYDVLGRDNIEAAIDRINSILKDLFPSK